MNKRLVLSATLATIFCFACSANAQITINIPNFPGIKKPKPTPTPTPEADDDSSPSSVTISTAASGDAETPSAKPASCESDSFYQVWNEDIQKTADDVRSFTPGRDYFVRDFNDNENKYLKMALSETERADDEKNWSDDATKRCVNARLDELGVLASKVIVGYSPVGYTGGTPAEKAASRTAVSDISKATVHSVGIKDPNWKIVYNSLGIPTGRKKLGKLWLKYPGSKYCTIVWANVWQPYAGGGTYSSSEGDFIAWEFAGCPAGK